MRYQLSCAVTSALASAPAPPRAQRSAQAQFKSVHRGRFSRVFAVRECAFSIEECSQCVDVHRTRATTGTASGPGPERTPRAPPVPPRAPPTSRSSSAACAMECGVAAYAHATASAPTPAAATPPVPAQSILSPTERSPAKSGLHVNFSDKGEVKERREKFLTAKYGSHQMALIRKRLAVEMWLYDELQKLYESNKESASGIAPQEVEVDIDELLDMDSDELRRRHLTTLLADAKKPQKDVHKFINELLEKAKTL